MSVLLFPCFFWNVWFLFVSSWFELFSFLSRKLWLVFVVLWKRFFFSMKKIWFLKLGIGHWKLWNWNLNFLDLRFWIEIWNLKFETLRLGIWNLVFWKVETWNFENLWFEILNMNFEVWNFCNLKFWGFWILKIGHLECGILNLGMKILNWKFGIWVLKKNLKFEIYDLKKKKRKKKLEIWTWSFILNRFQKICYQFSLFFLKIYSSPFMMWVF